MKFKWAFLEKDIYLNVSVKYKNIKFSVNTELYLMLPKNKINDLSHIVDTTYRSTF